MGSALIACHNCSASCSSASLLSMLLVVARYDARPFKVPAKRRAMMLITRPSPSISLWRIRQRQAPSPPPCPAARTVISRCLARCPPRRNPRPGCPLGLVGGDSTRSGDANGEQVAGRKTHRRERGGRREIAQTAVMKKLDSRPQTRVLQKTGFLILP